MDIWSQRVENSEALKLARELKALVAELTSSNTDKTFLDHLARLDLVVSFCLQRLENSDARLFSENVLSNLASFLTNLKGYVDSWNQGQPAEYLTVHAQNAADNLLNTLGNMPQLDAPGAREAVATLRRSVSGYRLVVDREVKTTEERIETTRQQIDIQTKKLEDDLTALSAKIADAEAILMRVEKTSQEIATTQQTAFTKAETDRSESFSVLLADKNKDLDAALKQLKLDAKNAIESTAAEVRTDKDAATAAREKVEEILGIVGEEALIGEYSKNATRDRTAADLWRWITVGSIGLAVGMAVFLAFTVGGAKNWYSVAAKIVVTLSFGGLAAYAGRQSAEHRRAQRECEQIALQLAALKPYLQDIDDKSKRDELLKEIAARLFGRQEQELKPGKSTELKVDDPTLTGLLLAVIQEVSKARGK